MNEEKLINFNERTADELRAITKKGGIASGKARREKKALKDALLAVLEERVPGSDLTKREAIAARVLERLFKEGDIRDLKVLAELIGEFKTNVEVDTKQPIIQVGSVQTAEALREILYIDDDNGGIG